MERNQNQQRGLFSSLIGEPELVKTSGLTFSAATFAPLVTAFVFSFVLLISGLAAQDGVQTADWYLYCSYLLNPITFAALTWWLLSWTKTPVQRFVKEQKCSWKYFLIALLMQFGLLSLAELNGLFLQFLGLFGYVSPEINLPSLDSFGFVGVLIVVAVLPAIFEEIIFRGFLLKGMKPFGTLGAVLVCGGLFALYHQNPAQTIYQFCCGAAFAWVAIQAGSILPTVVSHFLNNAYIIIMTKLGIEAFPTPVYIFLLVLEIISFIAAMVLLFLDKKPENGEKDKEGQKRFWLYALPGIALSVVLWLSVLVMGIIG